MLSTLVAVAAAALRALAAVLNLSICCWNPAASRQISSLFHHPWLSQDNAPKILVKFLGGGFDLRGIKFALIFDHRTNGLAGFSTLS